MADRVVIDASVALAYLMDEIGSPHARAALKVWAERSVELIAPSHFWLEVSNVLAGRYELPPPAVVEHFVDLDDLGIRTIEPDRPLLLLAIDQMVRHGLSAYHAIYLALALSTDAQLATVDRRLAFAAGDLGQLIGPGGPRRLAEAGAAYGSDRPDYSGWSRTAIVGRHIAELRRQALAEA